MAKDKAMAGAFGQMEEFTMASGQQTSSMQVANSTCQTVILTRVTGKPTRDRVMELRRQRQKKV